MIQLVVQRLKVPFDLGKVHQPTLVGIDGAAQPEPNAKAVTVEPSALVTGGNMGQAVGRLEAEVLVDFDSHDIPVAKGRWSPGRHRSRLWRRRRTGARRPDDARLCRDVNPIQKCPLLSQTEMSSFTLMESGL